MVPRQTNDKFMLHSFFDRFDFGFGSRNRIVLIFRFQTQGNDDFRLFFLGPIQRHRVLNLALKKAQGGFFRGPRSPARKRLEVIHLFGDTQELTWSASRISVIRGSRDTRFVSTEETQAGLMNSYMDTHAIGIHEKTIGTCLDSGSTSSSEYCFNLEAISSSVVPTHTIWNAGSWSTRFSFKMSGKIARPTNFCDSRTKWPGTGGTQAIDSVRWLFGSSCVFKGSWVLVSFKGSSCGASRLCARRYVSSNASLRDSEYLIKRFAKCSFCSSTVKRSWLKMRQCRSGLIRTSKSGHSLDQSSKQDLASSSVSQTRSTRSAPPVKLWMQVLWWATL